MNVHIIITQRYDDIMPGQVPILEVIHVERDMRGGSCVLAQAGADGLDIPEGGQKVSADLNL